MSGWKYKGHWNTAIFVDSVTEVRLLLLYIFFFSLSNVFLAFGFRRVCSPAPSVCDSFFSSPAFYSSEVPLMDICRNVGFWDVGNASNRRQYRITRCKYGQ